MLRAFTVLILVGSLASAAEANARKKLLEGAVKELGNSLKGAPKARRSLKGAGKKPAIDYRNLRLRRRPPGEKGLEEGFVKRRLPRSLGSPSGTAKKRSLGRRQLNDILEENKKVLQGAPTSGAIGLGGAYAYDKLKGLKFKRGKGKAGEKGR